MSGTFTATVTMNINAPIERVWEGITNPDMIEQYMMGARVDTDWKVGDPITWKITTNGKSYQDKGEILVVDRPHCLSFTHWSPLSDAEDVLENYHMVTFDLSETNGATSLNLTQSDNQSQEAASQMANEGWKPMLENLRKLLEQ